MFVSYPNSVASRFPAGVIVASAQNKPVAARLAQRAAERKRRDRISQAYREGEIELGVVMDEQGLSERKARKILTQEDYWRNLRENHPDEFAFHEALDWWKANYRRLLKAGEISFEAIQASPAPMHTTDMPTPHWPRIQAWARENVPWRTEGQRAAYEQGYHQRQRAHAISLFSWFTPQRRSEEWRAHYHKEKPPAWWHSCCGGDAKAWMIHRAELERMIADDNRGTF